MTKAIIAGTMSHSKKKMIINAITNEVVHPFEVHGSVIPIVFSDQLSWHKPMLHGYLVYLFT